MTRHQTFSAAPLFDSGSLASFAEAYPDHHTRLRHLLAGHPLLHRDALALLADAMPPSSVEYNLGKLPLGIRPEDTPANGLTVGQTIRTIADNESWVVLKNVERLPAYRELLDMALAPLMPLVEPVTGPMLHRECFLFVTSPGSITPFHMDPEHNILLQIEGSKTMFVFPTADPELVPARQSEAFHQGGHRNLVWQDAFAAKAMPVALAPGDAVLMPVKAPHYVRNGDEVSVSMSITWRSRRSVAEGELHAFNARLRQRGLPLISVSAQPERQGMARLGYRVARRLGL